MESVTPPTPVASSASAASSVSVAASASDSPAGSIACPASPASPIGPTRPAGGCVASRVELDNPPRPRLAFRVGIVGHRPDRLGNADVDALQKVLAAILHAAGEAARELPPEQAMLYDRPHSPILRALSPLAEGVDRIFAKAALAKNWDICCIMPFAQQEYEKDFAPPGAAPAAVSSGGAAAAPSGVTAAAGSLEEFCNLLQRAADLKPEGSGLTRFELDGRRDDAGAAYGAAGRMVLNQSDLLIVVWDGYRLGKKGGTEETFDEARRRGQPILWIDAHAPHTCQFLTLHQKLPFELNPDPRNPGTSPTRFAPTPPSPELPLPRQTLDAITEHVHQALALPDAPAERNDENPPHKPSARAAEDDPRANLLGFYQERRPTWTFAIVYQAFRSLIVDIKLPGISLKTRPFEEEVLAEWPRDRSSPQAAMIDFLRPFYAWPDKLASLYSDRYRSAFIIGYLLAAFAVCMALLPVALGPAGPGPTDGRIGQTLCGLAELAAIASILFLWWWARRRKWHNRWIDYRLAAELVRHLRLVAPLGGRRPFAQLLAHHANYGQPQATWMDWYVRAVARQIGLANGAVDAKYLAASLADMQSLIEEQAKYHAKAAHRCHVIEQRLHLLGFGLLAISLIAGLLHLFHLLLPGDTATFICGFLPALGAALAGINNQGEFRRLAKRSHAMERNLAALLSRAKKLRERITPQAAPAPHAASHDAAQPTAAHGPLSLGTPLHSSEVAALASDTARSLLMEVLDWRVVFLDRPLEPQM